MLTLLQIKLKQLFRLIFKQSAGQVVKSISYIVVISIFLTANYFIFFRIFSFLLRTEEIGFGLIYRVSSMMFAMFFILLMMSSIVSSITTFFRTSELEFLFTTPINLNGLFLFKLAENGFYSSWATAIVSFPLILALGKAFGQSWQFYLTSLSLFFVLIIISTVLGLILVFFFSSYFMRHSIGGIIVLMVLLLSAILITLFAVKSPQLLNLPKEATLSEINRYVETMEVEQFKYLPSGVVVSMIFSMIKGGSASGGGIILLLYILPLSALLIYSMSVYRHKYVSFVKSFSAKRKDVKNLMKSKMSGTDSRILLIIKKDIIIFLRDPSQWGQSLIFMTLLLFYGVSLIRSPIYFKTAFYTYILAFANMGFSSYIMATLSVRFIFPMISLEGETFQFVKASVPMKDFLNAKMIFNFISILILGELLVTGTNFFLGLDWTIIFISSFLIIIFAAGVTAINVGIGALIPEFREKNPSKIASGFGGIISAVFSLVYIGVSMSLLSGPVRTYFESIFSGKSFNNIYFIISISAIALFTAVICAVIYPISLHSLERRNT